MLTRRKSLFLFGASALAFAGPGAALAQAAKALERKGVQPVVALKANGGVRAEVRAGEPVTFEAVVEAPPRTGKIVSAEWDFEGAATFPLKAQVNPAERVTLKTSHVFAKPGTYFPTLRVTSQRQGDATTPFARIPSLQRVRVVVS